MDDTTKRTTASKNKEKSFIKQQEQSQKFELNVRKKKANIQKKFLKSVANNIYIFPRLPSEGKSTSSSDSEEQIATSYNLKSQNLKSRKDQTRASHNAFFMDVRTKQYNSVRSEKSVSSLSQLGKTSKNKKTKPKPIEIVYQTKKKTPSRTKAISQRKLFAEQYSLDNRIKKDYNGLIVSFRGSKKHQINISLSGRRMKTQIQ